MPQKQQLQVPVVTGAVHADDEVVAVTALENAQVAKEMNAFLVGLQAQRSYVGVSAFLIFALRYRVRVRVWYGTQCEDLVEAYAPWAKDVISEHALCHAVACKLKDGGLEVVDNAQHINHWVASFPVGIDSSPSSGISHTSLGEGDSEVTTWFFATYLSLSLHIVKTIADGDCGLDVMCLMLGWERSMRTRQKLRSDLCAFALRHIGNRAFIAMMHSVGELRTHLGLYELASAGSELFEGEDAASELVVDAASETHHGDGGAAIVDARTPETTQRNFSDEEIQAVTWKCRLQKSSAEGIIDLLKRLPALCIQQLTQEYKDRLTDGAQRGTLKNRIRFLVSRDAFVSLKQNAAHSFLHWRETHYSPLTLKQRDLLERGKIPYGWFADYVKAHPQLQTACRVHERIKRGNIAYVRVLRLYARALQSYLSSDSAVAEANNSAVAEAKNSEVAQRSDDDYFSKYKYRTPRLGSQYYNSTLLFQRDSKRRRCNGAGRRRSCVAVREMLATWYSIVRHSVNVKIMCRFPKKVLLVKATMLQQDYYASCLKNNVEPERVQVDNKWLKSFLNEYRLVVRKPNRKFKVPRVVLAERLKIFWLETAKLRKLVQLTFGYDPKFRNVDQSPFHGNEAGSAECNTIALKGAPTVPLIENHAATRSRWSLNSVTDSSRERIARELPGFELMFKAEGKVLEARLQAHVASQGLSFKVSVVTGPSGSYREHDILDFLEEWLLPWGPGREWEFFLLDAYAPGLTDNVQRLCWSRGYICVTHGGGASMVCQTNDTDHHQHVRRRFIELQTALMINKARRMGGGLVDLTSEENIDIMIQVMSDKNIHDLASKGYKYTGTTVALDGTEDAKIIREAKDFWQELGMRDLINSAVAEVEEQYKAGLLPWTYKTVQSLITPYPRRGHLDEIKIGQEDEATPDPEGVPWEVEEDVQKETEAANACDDVPDFDPADWVDPTKAALQNGGDADVSHHGDGDDKIATTTPNLEQSDSLLEHSSRLRSLKQAHDIFKELGGAMGASLRDTVSRVMETETRRFARLLREDDTVLQEMRAGLDAEEAQYHRQRLEFQEHMQQKRAKARVEHELKEAKAKLQRARKEQRDAEAVVTAMEEVKVYSLDMLGKGKKKAGSQQHQKARLEVLQRVRRAAVLAPEQTSQWEYFTTTWDREMAEAHGEEWAELFAQLLQKVLNDLADGQHNALSVFMHNETSRVLADTPALLVP